MDICQLEGLLKIHEFGSDLIKVKTTMRWKHPLSVRLVHQKTRSPKIEFSSHDDTE